MGIYIYVYLCPLFTRTAPTGGPKGFSTGTYLLEFAGESLARNMKNIEKASAMNRLQVGYIYIYYIILYIYYTYYIYILCIYILYIIYYILYIIYYILYIIYYILYILYIYIILYSLGIFLVGWCHRTHHLGLTKPGEDARANLAAWGPQVVMNTPKPPWPNYFWNSPKPVIFKAWIGQLRKKRSIWENGR